MAFELAIASGFAWVRSTCCLLNLCVGPVLPADSCTALVLCEQSLPLGVPSCLNMHASDVTFIIIFLIGSIVM